LPVIAQSIYYIKKFQDEEKPLPNVVFAGDKNECFIIGTAALLPYLSKPYDWSIAPSTAYKHLPLMADLIKDENIIPVVFSLDSKFSFDPIRLCIQNTALQHKSETPITANNIVRVFEYWVTNVLNNSKMDAKDVLDTFLMLLTQPQECYLHPKKPQILMIGDREVRVKPKMYKAFFTLYKETHNPLELRAITANKDRLFQEIYRRRTGAFFTPAIWVDEAHKMIAEQFSEDWKEKYVVWDCSCGTLNLTRDYKFKELYCSTLEQSDLDIADKAGYNPEAIKFQFDFLNDSEDKLPEGLKKALAENKPIIFFNNPPYGTSGASQAGGINKKGVSNTIINKKMLEKKLGQSCRQLYAQFLYKIKLIVQTYNLTQCGMGTFTMPTFLAGESYNKFRPELFKTFSFKDGMFFQASHFSDVSNTWGIIFTIFKSENLSVPSTFTLKIKDIDINGRIVIIGKKSIYNSDTTQNIGKWIKSINNSCKIDFPTLSSATVVKIADYDRLMKGALGYMYNSTNSVTGNSQKVAIFSSTFAYGMGLSILTENFWRCIAMFTARRIIEPNWLNQQDEYMVPNINHPEYQQWVNDALVYSLFESKSQQSSLRQIDYKDKKWDIINHFFFMSIKEMEQLAIEQNNNDVYTDTKTHPNERYVYQQLEQISLSPDAKEVLEMARELVRKSFHLREACNNVKPEMHINTWDAGWYQIKNGLLKDNFKEDYTTFVSKYKALENRLREGVYTFEFLRK